MIAIRLAVVELAAADLVSRNPRRVKTHTGDKSCCRANFMIASNGKPSSHMFWRVEVVPALPLKEPHQHFGDDIRPGPLVMDIKPEVPQAGNMSSRPYWLRAPKPTPVGFSVGGCSRAPKCLTVQATSGMSSKIIPTPSKCSLAGTTISTSTVLLPCSICFGLFK